MGQYDRAYYGGANDIALAKQSGLQGNFTDVSGYGEGSKYQDLLHAYKTGGNPVILGGAGATGGINDALYSQLSGAGANIQRIGGADRYQVQDNFKNYASALGKQQQVSSIYDAQQKSQLDSLKAQQDKALGQLTPQYQGLRNQADVTNQQDVNRLRELMAANGLNATGENITASAALSGQRQNALNQLNTQEQQQINDINDPAKQQSIISQIQAQKAQALMDAQNQSDTQAYQRTRDSVGDSRYNAEQAYQKQQSAAQQAWQKYIYDNLSADQKGQLASGKYSIDATNAANSSASAAQIAYYKSLGFNPTTGGGGAATATGAKGPAQFNKDLAAANAQGVDKSWNDAMTWIVGKESSYNPTAKNPAPGATAYGYAQFLASTRANYEKKLGLDYSNPVDQLVMMQQYLKDRYKTPQAALAFWQKNHWY